MYSSSMKSSGRHAIKTPANGTVQLHNCEFLFSKI